MNEHNKDKRETDEMKLKYNIQAQEIRHLREKIKELYEKYNINDSLNSSINLDMSNVNDLSIKLLYIQLNGIEEIDYDKTTILCDCSPFENVAIVYLIYIIVL